MERRSLPLVGELLSFQSDRLGYLSRLAVEEGDVAKVRLGPYQVWVLTHPDLVRDVLMTRADSFRKGPVLQRAKVVLGDGLLTSEGATHHAARKIVQPAFHSRHIKHYAHTMIDAATRTAESWQHNVPIDVHDETVRLTLATAGATLLAADVEREAPAVKKAIDDMLSAYKLAFLPFGWRITRLPIGPVRRLQRGRAALYDLVDRILDEPSEAGADVVTSLKNEAGSRFTPEQIRAHAVTMLLAGHETTANALAFAIHLLAQSPETESRVHAEVDEAFPDAVVEPDDVDRLPLCRAVLAEALRLYPPSWAMARQALEPHPVGEQVVAPSDVVMLPQWVVHRDPRWWPSPLEFDPDRWLGDTTDRPRWAFFPFGAGLRRCVGEGFAWAEGTLALAIIARRWRMRPVPERPVRLQPLLTLRPRSGVWVTPTRRG